MAGARMSKNQGMRTFGCKVRAGAEAVDQQAARVVLGGAPGKVSDCQIINSLARGLKVLSAFGPNDGPLSNNDLAARTGLPKPTISRLTNTLVRLNFLTPDPDTGGYRLGAATLMLGMSASARLDLPQVARPFMRTFAEEHDLAVSLGVRDGLEIRSLVYVMSDPYVAEQQASGSRLLLAARSPIGFSGVGYALIAALTTQERAEVFAGLAEVEGDNWANAQRRIEFALEDIARTGFCVSMREWNRKVNAVATPLSYSASGIALSLSVSGEAGKLSESRARNSVGPALLALRDSIRDAFQQGSPRAA